MRVLDLTACASLIAVGLSAAVPASRVDNRTLDEIYAVAQQESGNLVVVMGGDVPSQGNFIKNTWATRFPKIPLNLTVDYSKYHDSRIDKAFLANADIPDVAVLQTVHDYKRWKSQNRMMLYKPQVFDDIYPDVKDKDGAFTAFRASAFGKFIYDSDKIADADVPKSYADLVDPKYNSRLVMTYPNDDDAIGFLFSTIIKKHGFSWLTALAANNVTWVRGTATPTIFLNAQHNITDSKLALTMTAGSATAGATWMHIANPQSPDQFVNWSPTVGIFATTKKPESAKLFESWLVSDEMVKSQATSGLNVVRQSLDLGKLYKNNGTAPTDFYDYMYDRTSAEWWRFQFETVLGTAGGPSSLMLYP